MKGGVNLSIFPTGWKGEIDTDIKDLNILHRFVGAVEGVVISLPSEIQGMLYDYIEVVDGILDKEEKEVRNDVDRI